MQSRETSRESKKSLIHPLRLILLQMSLTGEGQNYKEKKEKVSPIHNGGARSGQFFFLLFLKNDSPFVRCDAPSSRSLALPSYMFDCCLSLFPLVWKSPFSPWSRIFNESPLPPRRNDSIE
jgi:hypothetical protein